MGAHPSETRGDMKIVQCVTSCAVVLALSSGCAAASVESHDTSPASDADDVLSAYPLQDVDCPVVPHDEYRLPESVNIDDYDTRFAVGSDSWTNQGRGSIVLLDLDDGTTSTVVPSPQTDAEEFTIITTRCSNRWIAWEEFAGSEQDDPWNVRWELYAARIAGEGMTVDQPQLIAESTTSIRSRPLFQVMDDRLYYMTNSSPNPEQEGAVRGSEINECDLLTGEQREVFTSKLNVHTFCAQKDELLVSLYVDAQSTEEQVRVIDLASGETRFTADLDNAPAEVSHWPAYRDGTLVWGELYSPNIWVPRLRMQTSDGTRFALAEAGSDPCFVGARLVYETSALNGPANVPWPTINVLDTLTGEHYVLLRTPGSMERVGFTLLPAQPPADDTLVVTGTVFGGEAVEESGTWVRRYRF